MIRHDLNTVKDFELFSPENAHGGLMSEDVPKKIRPSLNFFGARQA
ncbi:MAG: hypothetical protein M1392_02970 [Gammaproteobacteria bacterium]|nr:hypothetical protein [Gammaproteobacteria bacterium]